MIVIRAVASWLQQVSVCKDLELSTALDQVHQARRVDMASYQHQLLLPERDRFSISKDLDLEDEEFGYLEAILAQRKDRAENISYAGSGRASSTIVISALFIKRSARSSHM